MARLRIALPAAHDIAALLDWSDERFGAAGRRRYERLVETALRDIASDPERHGSREQPELGPGRRVYHLRQSRERARTSDGIVRSPRHILVYRPVKPDLVVVLRVLHDAMDLVRQLQPGSGEDKHEPG